jgi:hypothetical protein
MNTQCLLERHEAQAHEVQAQTNANAHANASTHAHTNAQAHEAQAHTHRHRHRHTGTGTGARKQQPTLPTLLKNSRKAAGVQFLDSCMQRTVRRSRSWLGKMRETDGDDRHALWRRIHRDRLSSQSAPRE